MLTKAQLYQINDFIQWNDLGSLILTPKYQRGAVWTEVAKSYFIDSILKDYPVPPIFLRQTIDVNTMTTSREVIDGQQRLRAILDFYQNRFPWKKNHSGRNKNIYFKDLEDDLKIQFLNYTLFVNIISQEEDSIIFDMFGRLNSNSVVVNKQENRNAKYWGYFKLFITDLGNSLRTEFLRFNIFKESAIIRMADLEFLNSITYTCLYGLDTESITKIDKMYELYDKEFDDSEEYTKRIKHTFNIVFSIFDFMGTNESYLFNKTYIFTIFCAIYHSLYKMKELSDDQTINGINNLSATTLYALSEKLNNLNQELELIFSKQSSNVDNTWVKEFERLHRTHTTSKEERQMRVRLLIDYLNANDR